MSEKKNWSFPGIVAFGCAMFFIGYMFSWSVNGADEYNGVHLIIAIALAIGARYPIKFWIGWKQAEGDRLQYELLQEEKMERQKLKREKARAKEKESLANLGAAEAVLNAKFTDNDFDQPTGNIVHKAVKQARKQEAKVTVPQLLKALTSNMR